MRKLPEQPPRRPATTQPPPPPPKPAAISREPVQRFDDDSISEAALEFNPNATDITKVFIEQPLSPEFTAATGTFKAIRLEAEDSARADKQRARPAEHEELPPVRFDPLDTQVDIEIDPDVLAAMAQMSSDRLARLDLTLPPDEPPPRPPPEPPAPKKATPPARAAPPVRQPALMQPPTEQPAKPPQPMRLAERAKARVDAARPAAVETAQAIRAVLTSRKRPPPPAESSQARGSEPTTSFHAGRWAAGSALLILLLSVQIVHHYRHDLAATASLNGPLTALYASLGIPLVPRWNLGAYEVRQLGASTGAEAPGQITVRASIKNGAQQSQPLPLLRVTLQDRFGNRIAARDVPPQSYLPRAIPGTSLLSAGQRIDAEMAFVDPGANAVGFEIDACLPAPGGGITCANDSAVVAR